SSYRSAMLFDDLVGDVESESAVISADCSSLEAPENSRKILRRNTDAAVLHHQHGYVVSCRQLDINGMSSPILDRVGDDVADGFLEPELVRSPADSAAERQTKFAAGVRGVLRETLGDFFDHIAQVAGRQIQFKSPTCQLRNVEQTVHQTADSFCLFLGWRIRKAGRTTAPRPAPADQASPAP